MNPQRALSPLDIESISPRLLLCAAVMAVVLMALFVDLLHDSVARGEQWREAQRNSETHPSAKPAETTIAQVR